MKLIRGTRGKDVLIGSNEDERVEGWLGDDTLSGGGGSDHLFGGEGNDFLEGGLGADQLYGDEGSDVLSADADDLVVDGGAGVDRAVLNFSRTSSAITYQVGVDTSIGSTVIRSIEQATFTAGSGNDRLTGGGLADTLNGGSGDDS